MGAPPPRPSRAARRARRVRLRAPGARRRAAAPAARGVAAAGHRRGRRSASACCSTHGIEISGGLGPLAGKLWRIGVMGVGAQREPQERLVARAGRSCSTPTPPSRSPRSPRAGGRRPGRARAPMAIDAAAFADLLAGYCLEVAARPGGARALDDARRAAAARVPARDPRPRRLAAAARRAAGRDGGLSPPRAATATSTRSPRSSFAEAKKAHAHARHPGAGEHARARRHRSRAPRARGARPQAAARADDAQALVRDAVADAGRRAAGRHEPRGLRGVRHPRAVSRPARPGALVGRAARVSGRAHRAPEAARASCASRRPAPT